MDEETLLTFLENIHQVLKKIESDISSISTWMPDETDLTSIEEKLDRIIELLEEKSE